MNMNKQTRLQKLMTKKIEAIFPNAMTTMEILAEYDLETDLATMHRDRWGTRYAEIAIRADGRYVVAHNTRAGFRSAERVCWVLPARNFSYAAPRQADLMGVVFTALRGKLTKVAEVYCQGFAEEIDSEFYKVSTEAEQRRAIKSVAKKIAAQFLACGLAK